MDIGTAQTGREHDSSSDEGGVFSAEREQMVTESGASIENVNDGNY